MDKFYQPACESWLPATDLEICSTENAHCAGKALAPDKSIGALHIMPAYPDATGFLMPPVLETGLPGHLEDTLLEVCD